ncbi:hypothetical protein HK098_002465 [Nowakowskiella sp. JEL0407]|nr:hypothetical protein HK098_002465 [Nowakowskiella sp. JEL0407]
MEPAATPTRFIKEISSNSDSLFSNPLATSNYTTSLSTINPFEQSFAAQQQSSPSDPKTPDAILDIAASLNQHDSSTNGVYLPSIQTFSKPLEQGDRKRAGSFGGSEFESTNGESSTNDDDLQLNQDIDNSSSQKRKKSKKDAMDEAKRQQFLERNRVAGEFLVQRW